MSNSLVALDPQEIGWVEDGREGGILRVRNHGDMVRIPFREGNYGLSVGTGGSAILSGINAPDNNDGTGTALNISTNTTMGAAVSVRMIVRGSKIGIRYVRNSNPPNQADFTAIVDGRFYQIPIDVFAWDTQTAIGLNSTINGYDGDNAYILPDTFSEGSHILDLVFTGSPSVSRLWSIYGLLLERRAGYNDVPRMGLSPTTAQVLSTTLQFFNVTNAAGSKPRGLRKMFYSNTTGTSAVATITFNGATIWNRTVPSMDAVEFDPGITLANAFFANAGGYQHKASVNSAIVATPIYSY